MCCSGARNVLNLKCTAGYCDDDTDFPAGEGAPCGQNFVRVTGYDFYGNDLPGAKLSTPDASRCRGVCYLDSNCNAYTYDASESGTGGGELAVVSVVTTDIMTSYDSIISS